MSSLNPFNWFKSKQSSHYFSDLVPKEIEESKKMEDKQKSRIGKALKKFRCDDKKARTFYKGYSPVFTTETIKGKQFVAVGDIEFCADYVCDISVHSRGSAPNVTHYPGMYSSSCSVSPALSAIIRVLYFSGNHIDIECNRHALEPLLIAVREACKDALRGSTK